MSGPPSIQDEAATAARQRQWRPRGGGRAGRVGSDRVPSPPRRRRPALAALSVVVIVGCALLAGLLALRMDDRVNVLTVRQDVPVGHQITADDLVETSVAAGDEVALIPSANVDAVIGRYSSVNIAAGQLLDQNMLTQTPPLEDGYALAGGVTVRGRVPATGLQPGDKVVVVRLAGGQGGSGRREEITEALVLSTTAGQSETLGEQSAPAVDLLVPRSAAASVVDASGNDVVGMAVLERGVSVRDADLVALEEEAAGD